MSERTPTQAQGPRSSTLGHLAQQERTRREILHKSDLIPPLPDLVARLLGLLNKQNTEPGHLEQLLQNDQVLVGKMLAMVNSPFYGLNRPIRTIKDAVMVLGFRGLRSLVLATGTAKFLQRDFSCYGHQQKGLWLHAICVAAGSRRLARLCRMGAEEAEMLFVAGLLHDIGKLLLVSYFNDPEHDTFTGGSLCEFERSRVGVDHAEAGSLIATKWHLASEVRDVIWAHHGEGAVAMSPLIAVVRVADALAHERGTGYLPGRAPKGAVSVDDLSLLGVTDDSWQSHRDELFGAMDEAVTALGALTT